MMIHGDQLQGDILLRVIRGLDGFGKGASECEGCWASQGSKSWWVMLAQRVSGWGEVGGDTGWLSTTQKSNASCECGPVQNLNSCFQGTMNDHLLKE